MFAEGETIIDVPVPTAVPPHELLYQCQTAPADNVPLTCSVEFFPEHIGEVPVAETGFDGVVVTLTLLLTQAEKQEAFSARTK